MIFADLKYKGHYADRHNEILSLLKAHFLRVDTGLQCDSWIWVWVDGEKVAIDSFSSMKHQVKSSRPGKHVEEAIAVLKEQFELVIHPSPKIESHESG
jgi:hypothetical protein